MKISTMIAQILQSIAFLVLLLCGVWCMPTKVGVLLLIAAALMIPVAGYQQMLDRLFRKKAVKRIVLTVAVVVLVLSALWTFPAEWMRQAEQGYYEFWGLVLIGANYINQ